MLAWIGVNLLGVGLHSYGWTSGAAAGLGAFVAAEAAFLAATFARAGRAGAGADQPLPGSRPAP